jgi:hypothetical protein
VQVTLKNRETLSGVITIYSDPVDVSGMSLLTFMLVVYAISGTSPVGTVQIQTSNDLETWKDVGSNFALTAVGQETRFLLAAGDFYQRYVRAEIDLAGTNPLVAYSLWADLYRHA